MLLLIKQLFSGFYDCLIELSSLYEPCAGINDIEIQALLKEVCQLEP